jgi:hypothetical protein
MSITRTIELIAGLLQMAAGLDPAAHPLRLVEARAMLLPR